MKVWVYQPRSAPPEVHMRLETVLEDMADDLYWAQQEDPDCTSGQWSITDTSVFVDDGGSADLVEIIE